MGRIKDLAGLKAYINRPEGPIEPLQTNWSVVPANDNNPEDIAEMRIQRRWRMRPSIDELKAAIVAFEEGDVEYGYYADGEDENRKPKMHRTIVRIGSLRFSDGTQTEKAYTSGADGKVIQFDAPVPVGAMLGTKDAQERTLGGDGLAPSNAAYTAIFKASHPHRAKRKSAEQRTEEKPAPPRTKAEMRAEIAGLPAHPVTKCAPGFPWKPNRLRELFLGVEIKPTSGAGSQTWQDIWMAIGERQAWAETERRLSAEDKDDVDALTSARRLPDVVPGKKGGNAYRVAKARLEALNDNIVAAAKKSAA